MSPPPVQICTGDICTGGGDISSGNCTHLYWRGDISSGNCHNAKSTKIHFYFKFSVRDCSKRIDFTGPGKGGIRASPATNTHLVPVSATRISFGREKRLVIGLDIASVQPTRDM